MWILSPVQVGFAEYVFNCGFSQYTFGNISSVAFLAVSKLINNMLG